MKLVTFLASSEIVNGVPTREQLSRSRLGILRGHEILDVNRASKGQLPPSMLGLLELPGGLEKLAELGESTSDLDLSDVTLLAPIPRPPSMRDGYAFRQHVEAARRNRGVEMIPEFDQFPVFYFTNHQAVMGPGVIPVMPEHLNRLDFELEAAIIIGTEGKNIKASEADQYIAGYTIMNDLSARVMQMEEMKMSLGPAKGKDFSTALGPYLLTRDELAEHRIPSSEGDRYDLEMTASLNGKEYSRGNLREMTWTFAQIIERASYGVTLYPGDVIGSGTVGTGCFLELNGSKITDNLWLKLGDEITCSIAMLGSLTNTITDAAV